MSEQKKKKKNPVTRFDFEKFFFRLIMILSVEFYMAAGRAVGDELQQTSVTILQLEDIESHSLKFKLLSFRCFIPPDGYCNPHSFGFRLFLFSILSLLNPPHYNNSSFVRKGEYVG